MIAVKLKCFNLKCCNLLQVHFEIVIIFLKFNHSKIKPGLTSRNLNNYWRLTRNISKFRCNFLRFSRNRVANVCCDLLRSQSKTTPDHDLWYYKSCIPKWNHWCLIYCEKIYIQDMFHFKFTGNPRFLGSDTNLKSFCFYT